MSKLPTTSVSFEVFSPDCMLKCDRCGRTDRREILGLQKPDFYGPFRATGWQDPEGWWSLRLPSPRLLSLCPDCSKVVQRSITAVVEAGVPGRNVP
jgi:hypothetical protein